MSEFPAITHVALTVTSLERSVPWYKDLFGSDPILDEDTGPFQRVAWLTGGTIVGVTEFPDLDSTEPGAIGAGPFDTDQLDRAEVVQRAPAGARHLASAVPTRR